MSTIEAAGDDVRKPPPKRKADQPAGEQQGDDRDHKQIRVDPATVGPTTSKIEDNILLETIPKVKEPSDHDKDQAVDKSKDQETDAKTAKQQAKDRNWKRRQKKKVKMDSWKQAAGIQ